MARPFLSLVSDIEFLATHFGCHVAIYRDLVDLGLGLGTTQTMGSDRYTPYRLKTTFLQRRKKPPKISPMRQQVLLI